MKPRCACERSRCSTVSQVAARRALATAFAFSAWSVTHGAFVDLAERIDACPMDGCVIRLQPGEKYLETRPWNLRGRKNFSILGHGEIVYFNFAGDSPPPVVIDATGAVGLHFEGWKMAMTSSSGKPDTGLLLARNPDNKSAGTHRFDRWQIQGWYRKAAVVVLASEVNVWVQCWLTNSHPDALVFWTGRDNELDVRSSFGPFGTGSTNTCHDFLATGFGQYGMVYGENKAGAALVIAGGTHNLQLRGGTMSLRGKTGTGTVGGRCALQLGSRGTRPVVRILLDAVEWETVGARNAVLVSGEVHGLTIRDSLLEATEAILHVEPGGQIRDAIIEGNWLIGGIGTGEPFINEAVISVAGTVEGCRIDLSSGKLIPLARDIPGRCSIAVYVSSEGAFRNNEVRIRRKEDIADFEQLQLHNRVLLPPD